MLLYSLVMFFFGEGRGTFLGRIKKWKIFEADTLQLNQNV